MAVTMKTVLWTVSRSPRGIPLKKQKGSTKVH
jgi:hypothetical protein